MQQPDLPLNLSRCPICRAPLAPDSAFCSECGTERKEAHAEELRAVMFLLSELERWRAAGTLGVAEADALRHTYERRLDDLRSRLAAHAPDKPSRSAPESVTQQIGPEVAQAEATPPAYVSPIE